MRGNIERFWPWIGWAAVVAAFPFDLRAVGASGAMIATVGYVLRIDRIVRPTKDTSSRAR